MKRYLPSLIQGLLRAAAAGLCLALLPAAAWAQVSDNLVVDAREALRKKDKAALATLKKATEGHALAQWVEYWELGNRLAQAQQPELDAFYARWKGSYVEDRLRNDWLLELGRRRDWSNFTRDFADYKMNDDREVTCYRLLTQHLAGQDVRDAARAAWWAQREFDDGCQLLASTLVQAKRLGADDVWQQIALSIEGNRLRHARAAAALLDVAAAQQVSELIDQPLRLLKQFDDKLLSGARAELATLSFMRMAASDTDYVAGQLSTSWGKRLPPDKLAQAWAAAGKQAALKSLPEAADHYAQAWKALGRNTLNWSDETLAWCVRAALRSTRPEGDPWGQIVKAVGAMSAAEQNDGAWVYWKARAMQARAKADLTGDADRLVARQALQQLAGKHHFYGKLATEELGGTVSLPVAAAPLIDAEKASTRANPGFARALQLIALGLRNEGVREWNFTLRGMGDRELLAAAQLACDREVWDRCINTSERTRGEVDMAQRFPTPYRELVLAKAREVGVDPAYVFALIRQESRFITDVRSHVGASGLMQLMPSTARWTAKRIGVPFKPEMITDRELNLLLGTTYLRLVLDDFGGSQALAAAAYNAGPGRPRRWREGAVMEPAAWAETIPFTETRDYVKKVLSNAVYYAAVLGAPAPSLKARLGAVIGPRDAAASAPNRDLP